MPTMFMDVDAALSEVPINIAALVDDTDFKTREESVTFDQAGLDLLWNFVTSAGVFTQTAVTPTDTAGVYDWVNQGNGMYTIEIPASGGGTINNDAEGYGWFSGFATGVLPWIGPVIGFRAAAINNALLDGGDLLDVSVTQWLGTACKTPATAGVPKIDLDHLFGVLLTEGVPGRLKAAFIKLFDVGTPTLVASDVMRGTDSAATAANLATVDTVVDAIKVITDALPDGGALNDLAAILTDTMTTLQAELDAIQVAVITNAAGADIAADIIAVKADTAATLVDTAQMNLGIVVSTTKSGTLSITQSSTNLTEATNDHYIGRIITFTNGVLSGQSSDITDYVATNGVLTYTAMTEAAGAGDAFKIT